MSQVYMTEPQTTGRVVLTTTHGPIDVNLWCRECPTTTRAFLQLCMDGYFNGMIFHRILNDFLIQTGLTRSTSSRPDMDAILASSEQSDAMEKYMKRHVTQEHRSDGHQHVAHHSHNMNWLARKKLELSPRIKFNHRGQIALAIPLDSIDGKGSLEDQDASASSLLMRQFFITLSEASFLNLKHVIFGTIAGPTIFNAIRIGKTDVDDEGVAVDLENCPKILSVTIALNPFPDLMVTKDENIPWKINLSNTQQASESDVKQRRKQRKGRKDVNVLSFADEIEDGVESGIQSIHDILPQTKKSKSNDPKNIDTDGDIPRPGPNKHDESIDEDFDVSSQNTILHSLERQSNIHGEFVKIPQANKTFSKELQNSSIGTTHGIDHGNEDEAGMKQSAVESRRAKYLSQRKGVLQQDTTREEATLAKLSAFRNKVAVLKHHTQEETKVLQQPVDNSLASRMALRLARQEALKEDPVKLVPQGEVYSGQLLETSFTVDPGSWMKTNFQCKRHMDTDMTMGGDGRNTMEEYQVIDSRSLRKGHEKNNARDRSRT